MKFAKIVIAFHLLLIFILPVSTQAADVAKIGVVDFQRLLELSGPGKEAQAKINVKGKEMEDSLKEKGSTIEELKKKFEREALVMSREQREEKEREMRIMINDFKMMQKKYMANFKELEAKLITVIKKDVFKIVEKIGKDDGYLLIVERREAGILYYPNTIDITDKLIAEYNKQAVAKK